MPWGNWLAGPASEHPKEIAIAVKVALCRKVLYSLPLSLFAVLQTLRLEQLLERGSEDGFNVVAGA
ncbi:hypothetical protein IC232_08320 [Microvirga sp. BT688]|uniref:hypothetical protein n=1 Tax=Microvirga sp. TaxID=1873136 RepID=UPI001684A93C|nr:hypothetical protein [Microvirga sp.]MBD2746702.1 hypothetical protein [Microvirga sp.]